MHFLKRSIISYILSAFIEIAFLLFMVIAWQRFLFK